MTTTYGGVNITPFPAKAWNDKSCDYNRGKKAERKRILKIIRERCQVMRDNYSYDLEIDNIKFVNHFEKDVIKKINTEEETAK